MTTDELFKRGEEYEKASATAGELRKNRTYGSAWTRGFEVGISEGHADAAQAISAHKGLDAHLRKAKGTCLFPEFALNPARDLGGGMVFSK